MSQRHFWSFQKNQHNPQIASQNIEELTDLAAGLMAFERAYLATHGERTPAFRLLSMINTAISFEQGVIADEFQSGTLTYRREADKDESIPF